MKRVLVGLLLCGGAVLAQEQGPALTELQKSKMEAHRLRVELAQAQAVIADREAKLAGCQLSAERTSLETEIIKDPAYRIDWQRLELVKQSDQPLR